MGHHNLQHTARCGWLLSTNNCCGQGELTLAVNVRSRLTVAELGTELFLCLFFYNRYWAGF
jgi:hypothetical protein